MGQGIGDLDSGFDNMNSTKLHDFMIYWQEDFYGLFYIEQEERKGQDGSSTQHYTGLGCGFSLLFDLVVIVVLCQSPYV